MLKIDGRCGHAVLLCLFLTWLMTCRHVKAISVDAGPQNASVREGDNVNFVCDLSNVDVVYDNVYWILSPDTYLTRNRQIAEGVSPSLGKRLSIIGDVNNNEFTLRIENVHEADSGQYTCSYCSFLFLCRNNIVTAVLTVLVPPNPQYPLCSTSRIYPKGLDNDGVFTVGDLVILGCEVRGGNPTAHLTFTNKEGELESPAKLSFLLYHYNLTSEDNGENFTCTMTTPALDEPRNCSVMPLRILPNVTINPKLQRVGVGSNTRFDCTGEGVPSIASYRWQIINTDTGETMASNRYEVSIDGRTVFMKVMENLELYCFASVPSRLTNNYTARIEVSPREATTSSSLVTVVVAQAVGLVVVVVGAIFLLLWQRKRLRNSSVRTQKHGDCDDVGENDAVESKCQAIIGHEYASVGNDKDAVGTHSDQVYAYAAIHYNKDENVSLHHSRKKTDPSQLKPITSEFSQNSEYEVPSQLAKEIKL